MNYERALHTCNATVPVADCGKKICGSNPKQEMKLAEYLAYLKTPDRTQSLYLKDWHFCKHFPDYEAYQTPKYFKSDWLNEYWDQCNDASDDYRFVYIGPKGSWTPFHADVLRSYSWSANICGRKIWYIYPPGQEDYLYDKLGNLAYDITANEIKDIEKYPKIQGIQEPIIVEQTEGEVIFIPSGWHHQVHNMEDTISINHNWTNACGLLKTWSHLQNELMRVQKSIEDCQDMDDWHQHCQLMLKSMAGMDYSDFINYLVTIAKPRLDFIQQQQHTTEKDINYVTAFEEWKESIKQLETSKEEYSVEDYCRYDISAIHKCVDLIQNDETFKNLDDSCMKTKIDKLLDQIFDILGEDKERWSKLATTDLQDTRSIYPTGNPVQMD
ncbi:2-oxoglutarate and iron-dependent oxygenase JMJD4-like [Actinia tenebrosa]|uniref:Jumonji domain-containing protein 4 n=1 Tax=Actinia tenebrosa TaxID=6105 RepID=A0A6P8IWM7_ACTTE|nr:2-oxoglutarate and iron-dependent oxygenase JMJD4-like [Actinia tenebrosa]